LWIVRQKRDVPHEAVLDAGSFEVAYLDGWPSDFFYFEDNSGRPLRPDVMTRPEAQRAAQAKARQEQDALDVARVDLLAPDESRAFDSGKEAARWGGLLVSYCGTRSTATSRLRRHTCVRP
jgi:hypothetical protein